MASGGSPNGKDPGEKGRQARCKKLKKGIDNKHNDINKKHKELEQDALGLPEYGPTKNFSTRQGHRREIKIIWNHLHKAYKEYQRLGC